MGSLCMNKVYHNCPIVNSTQLNENHIGWIGCNQSDELTEILLENLTQIVTDHPKI